MTIVTRFAPSPTGYLHIGHAASALFGFRKAKDAGGRFLLRIEDIDTDRCRPEFEKAIYEDLAWLGLSWENPVRRQSDHLPEYHGVIKELESQGLLYPCFCTRKDITESASAPHGPEGMLYSGTCRNLSAQERVDRIAAGTPYALRLDMAKAVRQAGPLTWTDLGKGVQAATPDILGDVVLARKDVGTSYHLSVTYDDHMQGVTLVTRGEDLFYATHLHRLLQALMNWSVPQWHHHPLLLDHEGKRFAKRNNSVTLRHMRDVEKKTPADIMKAVGTFLCALLLVCAPLTAQAAEPTLEQKATSHIRKTDERSFINLSVENDKFSGNGDDRNYTSGVRLGYFDINRKVPHVVHDIADAIPTFSINDTTSIMWSLGHNIYTPKNVRGRVADPKDRPWAAFLYGSAGLVSLTDNHVDEAEITLGVVGPLALGEQIQKAVHKIVGANEPKGWHNQLKNEPGVMVSWRRRWPHAATMDFMGLRLAAEPDINATLGNIYTYAGTGLNLRLGTNHGLLQDMPPRVRPAIPGTGYFETPPSKIGWYFFAGAEGRAVARNIFLDGNTFRDSPSVDKNPFVADLTAGLAFTYGPARLAYSFTSRTKEFQGQDDHDEFGSVSLTLRY